eukprot:8272276-Pyramimonas_sp.AAC.1
MAQDLCSGNTKITKWSTVVSGQAKYGTEMVYWEHEEHEKAYSWLRAIKKWYRNGVLGRRRTRSGL